MLGWRDESPGEGVTPGAARGMAQDVRSGSGQGSQLRPGTALQRAGDPHPAASPGRRVQGRSLPSRPSHPERHRPDRPRAGGASARAQRGQAIGRPRAARHHSPPEPARRFRHRGQARPPLAGRAPGGLRRPRARTSPPRAGLSSARGGRGLRCRERGGAGPPPRRRRSGPADGAGRRHPLQSRAAGGASSTCRRAPIAAGTSSTRHPHSRPQPACRPSARTTARPPRWPSCSTATVGAAPTSFTCF